MSQTETQARLGPGIVACQSQVAMSSIRVQLKSTTTVELPRSGQVARRFFMRRSFVCGLAFFVLLTTLTCFSQQDYIARYSVFTAFSYFATPSVNLVQRGFDADFCINLRSWLTIGGDFSYGTGSNSILPKHLNAATQAELEAFKS